MTWFIWKLSADQLIILLDRDQCSVSYFLASLGSEHRKTDTRQCCDPLTAVKTRYPLTSITWLYRGLRYRLIEVKYFFGSYPLTSYWFSNDRRLNFLLKYIWNMLRICAAQLKFWFQTFLGHENSASCYRQGRQLLFIKTFRLAIPAFFRFTDVTDVIKNNTGCFKSALQYSLDFSFLVLYILADLISLLEIQRLQLAGSLRPRFLQLM